MNGTCGAGRSRKHRKLYGGMGYGFDGSTIGTAGAVYSNSWGGEITKAGTPVTNADDPMRGSSRRKSKKGTKRRSRRRRGGVYSPEAAGGPSSNGSAPIPSAIFSQPNPNPAPGQLGRAPAMTNGQVLPIAPNYVPGSGMAGMAGIGAAPITRPTTTPGFGQGRSLRKSKKNAKRRSRKMRGGMSVAHASAGFTGTGERGLANYQDVGGSQPFSNNVVPLS